MVLDNVSMARLMNAATKKHMQRSLSGDINAFASATVRKFLEDQKPNLHMLYSAGWGNGYCVNGINP